MNENSLSKMAKNLGGTISKNSPTILTTLAVGGLLTTVIFAVRATPKAIEILEEHTGYDHDGVMTGPTKKEIVQLTWRVYIPAACMGAATIACIISSNSINQRRNAALASVYGLTEAAFREYKEKVVETIGKNKEQKVRDEITTDHIKDNPIGEREVIFTGKGDVLCYDDLSGRYFKSDIERIRQAINEINETRIQDMWVSLNDLYYELGLSATKLGEVLGWDMDTGNVKVSFSSHLSDENEPCLAITYDVMPKNI